MKIPSSHRSHRTPLQRSSPRDLAKTIARDETSMSTNVLANYSSTEYAAIFSCFLLHFYLLRYLYILDEKDKERTFTNIKDHHYFHHLTKTPPFSRPQLIMVPFYLHNSYHSIWYSWVTTSPLCTFLGKL